MSSNFKKYISMVLVVCMVIALACLVACKDNKHPEETTTPAATTPAEMTPAVTTPAQTTPAETTTAGPTETVTFPSDEPDDPKQEDNFFD